MAAGEQVLTVAQMREREQALIDGGESVSTLMERAGRGAAQWVWRVAGGRPVTVLCGPGNNGGDGYVIARELRVRGTEVRVIAPLDPQTEAAIAARRSYHGPVVEHASGGVFVDCLFGSGLTRPLEPDHAALLARLSSTHEAAIAVDLPSGIESDSGEDLNPGPPAYRLTLALGAWKRAHWLMPGMARMGERRLVEIGIAPAEGAARLLARPHFSPPALDAHKYSRGLLAVVGGAMAGAGVLAARAAMHAGAGYVKLFAPHKPSATPDELVLDDGPLEDGLADDRIDALLVGPGLGRDKEAEGRLCAVLARDLPTVLDADALVLLAHKMLAGRTAPLLLTPHAGELARLFERFEIAGEDRIERLLLLARSTGAVVIAKGPDTLIASADRSLRFAPPAPSWLSTAGTGDVLAGIAASRLATGCDLLAAAEEAVWLHGEAARLAGVAFTAAVLIQAIPPAYERCL
jgi:hydroxyethylthiazole kinase-like uncharacterized protein yjeF